MSSPSVKIKVSLFALVFIIGMTSVVFSVFSVLFSLNNFNKKDVKERFPKDCQLDPYGDQGLTIPKLR